MSLPVALKPTGLDDAQRAESAAPAGLRPAVALLFRIPALFSRYLRLLAVDRIIAQRGQPRRISEP